MLDVRKTLYTCRRESDRVSRLVEDLLVPMAAQEYGLERELAQRLEEDYIHIVEKLMPEMLSIIVEQYIAHKIFGVGGLLKHYLNQSIIKNRSPKDINYLEAQLFRPWRLSFMKILTDLKYDFYEMQDVLTGETFTLYSPAVTAYENEHQASLYFTLLAFNEKCYQTYGMVISFVGLQALDLVFYGSQVQGASVAASDVEKMIQADPVPFMMLIAVASFPLSFHKDDLLMNNSTQLEIDSLDPEAWRKSFVIEEKENVYRFSLKRWRMHPHFAHCYFEPEARKFTAYSSTERGWIKLVDVIRNLGIEIPYQPDAKASMVGMVAAENILGKNAFSFPYAELFDPSPNESKEISEFNHFLSLLLPHFQTGASYDLERLAEEAGISYENAIYLENMIKSKFEEQV